MVLFKINGERNSGTNFLKSILLINEFPVYSQKIRKKKNSLSLEARYSIWWL